MLGLPKMRYLGESLSSRIWDLRCFRDTVLVAHFGGQWLNLQGEWCCLVIWVWMYLLGDRIVCWIIPGLFRWSQTARDWVDVFHDICWCIGNDWPEKTVLQKDFQVCK
jgi:hypothetical protein